MVHEPGTGALVPFNFDHILEQVPELKRFGFSIDTIAFDPLLDSSEVTLIAPRLFLISGLKFVLVSLRYYAIAATLGIALGSGEVMAFVPSAQYAALLALTPGGLGIADWSWSGLLYKIGVGREHLVPYLISLRLVITLSVILLALISRLAYRKPQPKER